MAKNPPKLDVPVAGASDALAQDISDVLLLARSSWLRAPAKAVISSEETWMWRRLCNPNKTNRLRQKRYKTDLYYRKPITNVRERCADLYIVLGDGTTSKEARWICEMVVHGKVIEFFPYVYAPSCDESRFKEFSRQSQMRQVISHPLHDRTSLHEKGAYSLYRVQGIMTISK